MSSDIDEAEMQLHETRGIALDEEDIDELKTVLPALYSDCQSMYDDLHDTWVPDCYDLFFVACCEGCGIDMAGYDFVEEDYYGLDAYDQSWAVKEAQKKLMAMTKKDIIEAAHKCLRIFVSYVAIRTRYWELKSSIDILRGEFEAVKNLTDRISKLYEDAGEKTDWFRREYLGREAVHNFEYAVSMMPDEAWVQ